MNSNNFDKEKKKILNLVKEKKFLEVIKDGSKLLQQKPDDSEIIRILGITSINIQNFNEAEKYFNQLLLIEKSADNYYTLGNIQKKIKNYKSAINSFEEAIKLNPNLSEIHNNLGNTKKLVNKKEDAIFHYKRAISLKHDNIAALMNLASILKENNNYEELINIYNKILKLDNNNIKTIYNLGTAHLFLGNTSKGRECFEKVIKIDNKNIHSFRNYVSITKIEKENKIFNLFKDIKLSDIDDINKILLLDALSKCYFDLDEIKLAFHYLDESNLLKKKNSKFSMKEQEHLFKKIKLFFRETSNNDLQFINQIQSIPIFIIGMPRSGTSLLEQVLSSHSKIYGAGELNYLQKTIIKFGIEKSNNNHNYFEKIRSNYYEELKKISDSEYIIDKLPSNFRWVGFILKAFPEAKILHIKRNPMAVCWSNYKNFFIDSGLDFNLSQSDVARYYSMYSNLMKFWKEKFEDKILDVNYEIFVNDFEQNTKKILNYLNLRWEDQLLEYQKINRPVTTASHHQVRQKIKKDTSEKWKKYKIYLKEMQRTLLELNIKY